MHHRHDIQTLKSVEEHILHGIALCDSSSSFSSLAAVDVLCKDKKVFVSCVVIDLVHLEVLEQKTLIVDESMPYSQRFSAFREGPAVVELLKSLESSFSVVLVKGEGALHPKRVGLASYVGVMLDISCFGVSKDLSYGSLEEDAILVNDAVQGRFVRVKPYANPVYVVPGHKISIEQSVDVVRTVVDERYKLPLPLHLAHKLLVKLKKGVS